VRCVIGEGSHVEDSILMGNDEYEDKGQHEANRLAGRPDLGIGRNCRISGAIIDKNTRIGDGCVLSPQGKADGSYARGAVIIRDGVLVVPKNVHLPAGTVV
jgi:glucose-1-phosphate adenylyltransferase